ncbi:MAG: histidine kinase [Gemmatimonadales bacterium]|nr:histidine kinase [Gemmatimonadales bacterium]NIN12718.1 histidine kinase [Gemmatimonadales bacterium]NIQ99609.1 histidine kinase [Gemmatimonadales bacterium]NIS64166.1 histidine kinase [Gemmatimonadales bacterium]
MGDTETRSGWRRWRFLQLFAGATALGLIAASQYYLAVRLEGGEAPFVAAVVFAMPFWYLWALMTPAVVLVAKRLPIDRTQWMSRAAIHLFIALLFSFVHSAVVFGVQLVAQPSGSIDFASKPAIAWLIAFVAYELTSNLLAYGTIVGITHAIGFYRRFRERQLAAVQLETQLARAQIHALRMQLNPHFLFNAMNSIAMLIRHQQRDEAVRTVAGLSDLLRYVLEDTRDQEVPLRQELEFVRRYLAIEEVRFRDRLEVRIDAEPDTLDALVPNLVLQPLVENAIRHGIAKRAAAGLVTVSARRSERDLVLEVTDDGPGLSAASDANADGVGISNTRARLARLYGDRQNFEIANTPSPGAVVRVTVPFHTEPVKAGMQSP